MKPLRAFSRRDLLIASGALFASGLAPTLAHARRRDPRLLVLVLRGGLDGLAAVAPVGDPGWVSLRRDHALTLDGAAPALGLDDFFALNPAMPRLHRMFAAHEAIIVHACATPYRERSHRDGLAVLQSGLAKPRAVEIGWLTRALTVLGAGGCAGPDGCRAFGAGAAMPLVPRGPATRMSPAPAFVEAAWAAASLLARPDGPRVGALALDGFDTHDNEGIAAGRLSHLLGALDAALAATKANLGPVWRQTVVALVTEFGRTARINDTGGTDHGTATVALLAGGALNGGRVIADWPGLGPADLYETRDLAATTDLRAVLKGLPRDHWRIGERPLAEIVFPGSEGVKPMAGLIA